MTPLSCSGCGANALRFAPRVAFAAAHLRKLKGDGILQVLPGSSELSRIYLAGSSS
jgi:hypothetical protein